MRLTQYAQGGGCSCKIPPGELESLLRGLAPAASVDLLVGLDHGDDAAVVRLDEERALVSTTDFFAPVVDDAFDFGRIAAANALSDVYAVGGMPLMALNLLGWPRSTLPMELAAEVLRGGAAVAEKAGCALAGGHSIDDAEPKYGLAATGLAHPERLLTVNAGAPGTALVLSKPLGVGVLNSRHKATGEVFAEAVEWMTTLNDEASRRAVESGARCATDVTGFGLLGHLSKVARAAGLTAVVEAQAVSYIAGAREAVRDGYVSGGTRRNLEWVAPWTSFRGVAEEDRLLLADAQTSGGLLVAGELPGFPVIGELVPRREALIEVR
jgi:selenide, water dikinase